MAQYSIRDLEKLSGIKAHTIRIWEKRYNAIEPQRTDTNIRFYTDEDLKKLLNISILNRHGIKISHIMRKNESEINNAIQDLTQAEGNYDSLVESLVISMIELDEMKFEKVFSNAVIKHGFENTIIKVIYPFLEKVGVLWQIGEIHPAQEHFVSNLVRQKLIVAIDSEGKSYVKDYNTYILFLPEGELHEFGLLFYYFLIRHYGHKVIYLGQTVPYEDLKAVTVKEKNAFLVTSFVTHSTEDEMIEYTLNLAKDFKSHSIFISGQNAQLLSQKLPKNVKLINKIEDLKKTF